MEVKRIKCDLNSKGEDIFELEFVKKRKTYTMLFLRNHGYPYETVLIMKGGIDDYERPIYDSLAEKGSSFEEVLEEYHYNTEEYSNTVFSGSRFYNELPRCKSVRDLYAFTKDKLLMD